MEKSLPSLRGQSRIRYSLPPPGFSEPGIHLASATGKSLGFLWIHVQRSMKWPKKNLDSFFFLLRGLTLPRAAVADLVSNGAFCWPLSLHKILYYFKSFSVGVNHPLIAPPTCKAYPIAILLHDYCAIYDRPPTSPVYADLDTILVMAISC